MVYEAKMCHKNGHSLKNRPQLPTAHVGNLFWSPAKHSQYIFLPTVSGPAHEGAMC